MSRRSAGKGILAVAFGVGLLLSFYCPSGVLIVLLSLIIIWLGFSCMKNC